MKTILTIFLLSILTAFSQGIQIHSAILYSGVEIGIQPWYPTNIYGCTLWLAADQSQLAGYADGAKLTNWWDNSGNGMTVTQATLAYQPIYTNNTVNGKPALIFTNRCGLNRSSIYWTNIVDSNLMTLYLVERVPPNPDSSTIKFFAWNDENDSNSVMIQYGNSSGVLRFMHSGDQGQGLSSATAVTITNSTWHLIEMSKSGLNNAYIYTNSVLLLNDSTVNTNLYLDTGTADIEIGKANSAQAPHGEIAEVIVYNRFLAGSERTNINNYIKSKYALW